MNLRFVVLALALTGCTDLIEKIAQRQRDRAAEAGAPAATATATGTATTATDDDSPPDENPSATPTGKSGAVAAPAPKGKINPADLEKAFAALDINDDNQLDGIEVKNCGCSIADANGDNEITKAEYLAAGLLGKFKPGPVPTSNAKTTPTPAQTNDPSRPPSPPSPSPQPAPTPVATGGLPTGTYRCSALVGGILSTMGTLKIVDGSRYSAGDGSGAGNYTFDPGSKEIRFTSGMYAAPDTVKSARQISDTRIQLRQGKSGFTVTDCKR